MIFKLKINTMYPNTGVIGYLKKFFTNKQKKTMKNWIQDSKTIFYGHNLNKLAEIYKTDKYGSHYFTQHYQTHFKKFKYKRINLLEIGVGGYKKPQGGGQSLRMWKRYFPFGRIFSIDIYDKSFLNEPRVEIYLGSQVDPVFMKEIIDKMGTVDLVVDDGSHHNDHVWETFKIVFPYLKDGGFYAVEDTQTSYWEDFGGDPINLDNQKTTMNHFKKLPDGINFREYARLKGYIPTYFDENIVAVHFYHNLIIIEKGKNTERSMRE